MRRAINDFISQKYGADKVNKTISRYQEVYKSVEGSKTFEDAAEEYAFDNLLNIFLADDGGKEFFNYLNEEYTAEEKKSILEKIAEFFKDLIDRITNWADGSVSFDAELKTIREIRENVLDAISEGVQAQNASVAAEGGETRHSLYITDEEIENYLQAGDRKKKNKIASFNKGEQIAIHNYNELVEYITEATKGKRNGTVAYGKVDNILAEKVLNASDGKTDIKGKYLELNGSDLYHAYKNHREAKGKNNIPMLLDDLIYAIDNINDANVYEVKTFADSNKTQIKLTVPVEKGLILLIENNSRSRGSLLFKNAWGIKKRDSSNTEGDFKNPIEGKNPSALRDDTISSDTNVSQSDKNSKRNSLELEGLTEIGNKTLGYTNDRIEQLLKDYAASSPNYAQAYVTTISPKEYLNLTTGYKNRFLKNIEETSKDLDLEEMKDNRQPIFIEIDKTGEVVGHEGRHRVYALQKAGFNNIPVLVFDYSNKYSKEYQESMDLMPQWFRDEDDNFTDKDKVTLKSLIPFSRANEERIKNTYGENAKADARYSLDVEYDEAVENNDTEKMEELVETAARTAGYDSPKLYHGTQDFGFTQLDTSMSDDGFTFFATNNPYIASSYSGVAGERKITENRAITDENIADMARETGNFKKIIDFPAGDTKTRYDYLRKQFKRMSDFVKKNEKLMYDRNLMNEYREFSNALTEGILFENLNDREVAKNIRGLLNPLSNAEFVISDYAYDILNGLLLTNRIGVEKHALILDGMLKTVEQVKENYLPGETWGNYGLYANTDNMLEVDGKGANWNTIQVAKEKESYTPKQLLEMLEDSGIYENVSYSDGMFNLNGTLRDKGFVERVLHVDSMHQSSYETLGTREIAERAKNRGYDGVIVRNITDDGGKNRNKYHNNEYGDIYIFFNPQQ